MIGSCLFCNKIVELKIKNLFCSMTCKMKYQWKTGELKSHKPYNKLPEKTILCPICGKAFIISDGRTKRKYCSRECYWGDIGKGVPIHCHGWNVGKTKETDSSIAKMAVSKVKERVEKTCPICGDVFKTTKNNIRKNTCSRKCSYVLRGQKMKLRCEQTDLLQKAAEGRRNSKIWKEAVSLVGSKTMTKNWESEEFRDKIVNNPLRIENAMKASIKPEAASHHEQVCQQCGKIFIANRWKFFCSSTCYWKSLENKPWLNAYDSTKNIEVETVRRSKISKKLLGRIFSFEEVEKRKQSFKLNYYSDPVNSLNRSNKVKKMWDTLPLEKKNRRIKNAMSFLSPNKLEIKLDALLKANLPGEYKYVGDGQFILAGKCPDFININGKKEIIEVYGDYWHKDDDPQERIDLFKKYGYKTLILWEHELRNEEKVLSRFSNFRRTL